eukprot:TRINITY_DN3155_c0_g1_i3.p1 TRINITY_DN3155_c0_g1~~TRINITY_DN3155_c0_g1_i3.p1  ORF type:complete len:411 (+),score=50.15 TRINITY_DN3155_c0_g1_i3:212-1444(+)
MRITTSCARVGLAVYTVITGLFTFGIVFGFPSLELILKREGIYFELCNASLVTREEGCDAQSIQINLLYTISLVSMFLSSFINGILIDILGKRVVFLYNSFLFAFGLIIFAVSDSVNFVGLIPGLICISWAAVSIYICVLKFQAFYEKPDIVLALWNNTLNSSSGAILLLNFLSSNYGFTKFAMYLGYVIVPVSFIIFAIFFWPLREKTEEKKPKKDYSLIIKNYLKIVEENITSPKFLWYMLYFALGSFLINPYFGELSARLRFLNATESQVTELMNIFNIIIVLPFLISPLIGYLITTMGNVKIHFIVLFISCSFLILRFIPILESQIITFIFFAIFRGFFFSSCVGYLFYEFGAANFGLLYGISFIVLHQVYLPWCPELCPCFTMRCILLFLQLSTINGYTMISLWD